MRMLLIFNQSLFTPFHQQAIVDALPDIHIIYCDNTAAPEQLCKADFILGNPNPALLRHCKQLKLLQLVSAGTDGYLNSMPHGAMLTNATGGYGLAISEHILAMLLTLMKKLHLYQLNQIDCRWQDEGNVTSVYGSTVLIIGLGDIGGELAKRIHALGGYTIGVRRTGKDKPDYLDELYDSSHIDILLPRSDVVALCLPATPQTKGIMDQRRIGLMKAGSFLLNVGRGSAVDQDALCNALNQGFLGGAGLDVTDPEPLPTDHPLWKASNVLITPHISGGNHLSETFNRIVQIAIHNFNAVQNDSILHNEVDFSTGYRKL